MGTAVNLTQRERQIVKLVAEGRKNKDIADIMQIKEHSIKNYLRTIYEKLGFTNRVEIALWHVHQEMAKDKG